MLRSNRRNFLTNAFLGSMAAALPISSCSSRSETRIKPGVNPNYAKLDEIAQRPVLKKELFTSAVTIKTLEWLRFEDNFLCRVRSSDGAEGISIGNYRQQRSLYPIFANWLQPFFIGKDARDLELLLEQVMVVEGNYKAQSLAIWLPLATIEFAILDMLGRMANKSIGQLIGDIHNTEISVYQANSERDISAEETVAHLQEKVAESKARAVKFKLGGRMTHPEFPVGRSEKLIPLVRKTFGDKMVIYADANGSYGVDEAIRIGKIMQDYNCDFFEEPVPFDWYEETKQVADALKIPIAGGEQEASFHNFRWLIGNDTLKIVQPDMFYFGGIVRSMRVARMAHSLNLQCTPHTGGSGFLYMMHLISAIPNAGPYHEYKGLGINVPFECRSSSLKPDNGIVKIPDGPGSGVDFTPDVIAKHKPVTA